MEIVVGKTAGFCYGVKKAVNGAIEELKNNKDVYCLGEIVHNRQVIKELEDKGMNFIEKLSDSKGTTIIRAHGVPKEIYEYAKNNNLKIVDYTCPNVLKIHEIAEEYSKNGYYIFLCGSINHPENIGTASYCGNNYYIVEKEEDIYKAIDVLKQSNLQKVLLIAQTTYSLQRFENIKNLVLDNLNSSMKVVIKNTICRATELRQKETKEMSQNVDCMIVIGGKNSSNTKKLYEIAIKDCRNSICIETEEELDTNYIKGFAKVGIMAGASTPQESINKVIEKIK